MNLVDLLTHLVRLPTTPSDHATNQAALDWVEEQLRGLPLAIIRLQHPAPALVATTPAVVNPHQPRLWLYGHLDVVPSSPAQFQPYQRHGRLYGRGVFDMKYAIAIYIAIFRQLQADLHTVSLGLMLTTDEEVGGATAKHLAQLGYGGTTMLMPECGRPWEAEIGAKGMQWWRLTARGQSGHASRPWEGINAIDQLTRYVDQIRTHFPTEPCGDPEHRHSTYNLSTIAATGATNQIPDHAEATIDIRVHPPTDSAAVQTWFNQASLTFPGVTPQMLIEESGFELPPGPAFQAFEAVVREITGRQLGRSFAHGSSDARFFAPAGTAVITVPTTGGGQHSTEEWIDLTDLEAYYQIVRRFVTIWAGVGSAAHPRAANSDAAAMRS